MYIPYSQYDHFRLRSNVLADQCGGGDETVEILTHVLLRMNHLKFGSCGMGY
jgi:hypothetical protein